MGPVRKLSGASCASLAALAFGFALLPLTSLAASTNHVIILVMDGARYSETWGDPMHANIPYIATQLAPQGVVLTNFYTDITTAVPGAKTDTNPGHATLVCGTYQNIANDGSQLPLEPTIFQYYRQQTAAPATSAWVITSKDKLVVLSDSSKAGWNGLYQPSFNCGVNGVGVGGYREDYLTHPIVRSVLTNYHPAVMIINYKGPDAMGHASDWSGYLAAIREVDGYAADLWAHIQADPILKDTTTLFITNDHGRHTSDFTSHGDGCEGCCHLLCVVVGPGLVPNQISGLRRTQPDIGRTAAELLSVSMPTATGQVMSELYQSPALTIRPDFANRTMALSWPVAPAGYTLMMKTSLQADHWEAVPDLPELVGSRLQVVLPATNSATLFRLMR